MLKFNSKSIEVKKGTKGFGLAFRDKVEGEDDRNGVFVDNVTPDGPADLSGIKKSDNILKINGQQPKDLNDAKNLVRLSADLLKLDIFHGPLTKMESANGEKMMVNFPFLRLRFSFCLIFTKIVHSNFVK